MKINKLNLLLITIPLLSTTPIVKFNNLFNKTYISKNINLQTKISLTTLFIENKLDNEVYVGQENNITKINSNQITDAINKEVLNELNNKVGKEVLQPIDFDITTSNIDNTPLSPTINLENPILLKINIKSKHTSKILKDETTITSTIKYPIFNFEKFLKQGILDHLKTYQPATFLDLKEMKNYMKKYTQSILELHNVGQPKLYQDELNFNYFGESIFENNDDIEQTYETPSVSKTISNETEVDLTSAINTGATANFSFLDTAINLNFTEQKTVITKSGDTKTFTAPTMPVVVKPHHKTQVLVYLNSIVSSQNITLDSDIDGKVFVDLYFNHLSPIYNYSVNIKDIVKYYQDIGECPNSLSLNSNNTVHLKNEAQIFQYGTGTFWHAITNPLT